MTAPPAPFSRLLIANRGEIACRIIRSARALGMKTIAVYSDADAPAVHVRLADDAVHIGPSPAADSYLNQDRILKAAKDCGAEAIHPGYGFLSENAEFAEACAEAGLIFIGPPPHAIDLMGDKAKAKRRMIEAGVPCIPGYQGDNQSVETLTAEAAKIGLPVMVKAAAGGGGRGMRLVSDEQKLSAAIKDAASEAENAFGSGRLILEKAIVEPRHVEIQVFADAAGNTIHLGERDCSVQRRHQKVLEEAPCPVMTPELREKMGAAAVKAARDIDYVGAGTVEFLLDKDRKFYFLEMNTRLQVEHPVTEEVTGLDLVAMQLRIAQGEPLGLSQSDVTLTGHAIEARLYAEDTAADFLPATGDVRYWRAAEGAGVRVDSAVASGSEVSPFYDPMIAKVIGHGATRDEARRALLRALRETAVLGLKTNKAFLIEALETADFAQGKATTAFVAENFPPERLAGGEPDVSLLSAASAILYLDARRRSRQASVYTPRELLGWSSATAPRVDFRYAVGDEIRDIGIEAAGPDTLHIDDSAGTKTFSISAIEAHVATFLIDGRPCRFDYFIDPAAPHEIHISDGKTTLALANLNAVAASKADTAGEGAVTAPMHGALVDIFVTKGDAVSAGDRLAVLEAMKMQHELLAQIDGVVGDIHFAAGAQVPAGELLMTIEPQK